jgi:hypothetical protein
MVLIINKERLEFSTFRELEPLKQLAANFKPAVIKRQPKKPFVFYYQIDNGICKYSSIKVEGLNKWSENSTSYMPALYQFKKQVRREAGINNFALLNN